MSIVWFYRHYIDELYRYFCKNFDVLFMPDADYMSIAIVHVLPLDRMSIHVLFIHEDIIGLISSLYLVLRSLTKQTIDEIYIYVKNFCINFDILFIHDSDNVVVIIIVGRSREDEYTHTIHVSDFKSVIL